MRRATAIFGRMNKRKPFPYKHLKAVVMDSQYRVETVAVDLMNISKHALLMWMNGRRPPAHGMDVQLRALLRMDEENPGAFMRALEAIAAEDGIALSPKTPTQTKMQKSAIKAHNSRKMAIPVAPKAKIADLIKQARARG